MQRHKYTNKNFNENVDVSADFIHPAINTTINKNEFPSFLKREDVIPVFKKISKTQNTVTGQTYLKNISKAYERVMLKQIEGFMGKYFLKFQCALRKGCSTQQCLIDLIEKWKSATHNRKSFGALLTD